MQRHRKAARRLAGPSPIRNSVAGPSLILGYAGIHAAEAAIADAARDMQQAYIMTVANLPEADANIAFDSLHIGRHADDAVDKVRFMENRTLRAGRHNWAARSRG